jgi:PGF-pre-PGF domain-containing protein
VGISGFFLLSSILVFLMVFPAPVTAESAFYEQDTYPPAGEKVVEWATLWLDNRVENLPPIEVFHEKTADMPSPELPVVCYLRIEVEVPVRKALIRFRVPWEWLERYRVPEDGIVLMKLNGDWNRLQTRVKENFEDYIHCDLHYDLQNYVYYEATAENFSLFAIVGHPAKEEVFSHVLLIVVGVAALASLYWLRVRPRKRFVSLKKLETATGEKIRKKLKPEETERITAVVKRLKEATGFGPEAERVKPEPRKSIEREEDTKILKELKREMMRRRER